MNYHMRWLLVCILLVLLQTAVYCQEVDECASDPCLHDARCTDGNNGYICECLAGYAGTHCETDIDDCVDHVCAVDVSTCVDGVDTYTCACVDGITGLLCETELHECASDPCLNGGSCVDHINSYTCVCVPGYVDTHCETDFDECSSDPCQNGGTCADYLNYFNCTCEDSTLGSTCMSDPCIPTPCLFGGTCQVNTTIEQDYTAICTQCVTGFSGENCEDGPCENGTEICYNEGACNNLVNGTGIDAYGVTECDCTGTGYSGDNCTILDPTTTTEEPTTTKAPKEEKAGTFDFITDHPYVVVGAVAGLLALCLLIGLLIFVKTRPKKRPEKKPLPNDTDDQAEPLPQKQTTFTRIGQAPGATPREPTPVGAPTHRARGSDVGITPRASEQPVRRMSEQPVRRMSEQPVPRLNLLPAPRANNAPLTRANPGSSRTTDWSYGSNKTSGGYSNDYEHYLN